MAVRPLDLQVNMNTLLETSRDQGVRQTLAAQEQRSHDNQAVEDAKTREKMVNKTPKPEEQEELEDKEKHFGNKTEPELEREFSEKERKRKKEGQPQEEKEASGPERQEPKDDGHVDYLA